jgi:adenylate kinase family enzyme
MYQYWAYGLLIESELEFPEFLAYPFEKSDVTIRIGNTPAMLSGEDHYVNGDVSMDSNRFLLKLPEIATYYAQNGNEVIVAPLPNAELKSVRLFLLSNVLSAILHQRNLIPLHASGIIHNDQVILFCGESGAGKSTLVTKLQQSGYQLFTDDVCVIIPTATGKITLVPSYPMIKLWADSFERIGLPVANEELRIRAEMPKYATFYHDQFDITPREIKQIFILAKDAEQSEIAIRKLSAVEAFTELQQNSYRRGQMRAMNKKPVHFSMISSIIKDTPTFKSTRPASENTLDELMQKIVTSFI